MIALVRAGKDRVGALPGVRPGARIFAVAACYYVAGELGLLSAIVRGQVSPLWPPTGVALVFLLLWGLRVWPGITLGAFLVNIPVGPSVPVIAVIALGNTLAPVVACLLLARVRFSIDLRRMRDALCLVFLGAFAGMLISATVGSAMLVTAGSVQASQLWSTWWVWWTGDAIGVLIVVPFVLAARAVRAPLDVRSCRWWAEAVALLVSALVVMACATRIPGHWFFLVFPVLIWAACRFELAGASVCVLIVTTMATLAAAERSGPFTGLGVVRTMAQLQVFNGTAALTGLLLAVLTAQRNHARLAIKGACAQLATTLADCHQDMTLLEHLLGKPSAEVEEAGSLSSREGK
ncbi:MASE1 domain-containing protein [Kutzneria buriramensis]|uniref:Integral membrane sensor domain MASE1 n=1 Tax=Kutzneria buriramensis TaxID=1045776 RepID=A0A3E0HIB6_9PSEU|nr:MASE1 domain-containing protein [Kutzneria buriramensis]REH46239.1 integral membrane sensor domain MASE1 [Kutzneria buriramensis]